MVGKAKVRTYPVRHSALEEEVKFIIAIAALVVWLKSRKPSPEAVARLEELFRGLSEEES